MRVATFNIHSGVGADGVYDLDRLAAAIQEHDAHVVALQEVEVNAAPQRTRLWSVEHAHDQPRELARRAGFAHFAFAAAIERMHAPGRLREVHGEGAGSFGVALLSRSPLLETRELRYTQYGRKSPRNAVAARLELGGVETWVVCTHLGCHVGPEQAAQMAELLPWVDALGPAPVMVMGDLNSPPFFEAARMLRAHTRPDGSALVDSWAEAGRLAPCRTFPASRWAPAVLRLDYLLYAAAHLRVVQAETPHSLVSDHRALVVGFVVLDGLSGDEVSGDDRDGSGDDGEEEGDDGEEEGEGNPEPGQ